MNNITKYNLKLYNENGDIIFTKNNISWSAIDHYIYHAPDDYFNAETEQQLKPSDDVPWNKKVIIQRNP